MAAVGVAMVVGGLQALRPRRRVAADHRPVLRPRHPGLRDDGRGEPVQHPDRSPAARPASRRPKPAGFTSDYRYYYLCLAFLAVVLWVDWRLMKTKGGRALLGPAGEPPGGGDASAPTSRCTRSWPSWSPACSPVSAGALLAHNDTFVVRDLFDFQLALVFVIMTVVGGLRNRAGVVVGSAFFALSAYFFEKLFSRRRSTPSRALNLLPKEYAPIVIGPILLLFTLTTPSRRDGPADPAAAALAAAAGGFSFKDTHDAGSAGERCPCLRSAGCSIRFGGVQAARDVTLQGRRVGDRRDHRPQRRRQDDDVQHHHRLLPARRGQRLVQGA